MPTPRNLGQELGDISGQVPSLTSGYVNTQAQFNPQLSRINAGSFGAALLGDPTFDAAGYLASRPDLQANFDADPGYASFYGSLDNYAKADFDAHGKNDPRFVSYNNSGAIGLAREAWNAANPGLVNYTNQLGAQLGQINSQSPQPVAAATYNPAQAQAASAGPAALGSFAPASFTSAGPAAQASFTPAQAYAASLSQAAQQRASGGPLLNPLQRDAMSSLNSVSPLQAQQQQIATDLLGQGGNLSAQDTRNVQQDTRAAFAARGLYDSNQAIGAEVMNTDAARRQRLMQNVGLAQGVDAAGQQQIGANRGYALGVQGQGQNLSQFNAGQGNQLGLANAGMANDLSRFNASNLTQNSQFNSQLGAQTSQFNAGAQNQMSQFNSGQANALGQFNAGQAGQMSLANAGAQNNMAQFGAGIQQQANLTNAGAMNTAGQFGATAQNQMGMFNAQLGSQNANDQWNRAMQLGNFQMGQAIDPLALAGSLAGQAPDYTGAALGYGQDLYNTNYNGVAAAQIAAGNNSAAKTSAGIGAAGTVIGAGLVVF